MPDDKGYVMQRYTHRVGRSDVIIIYKPGSSSSAIDIYAAQRVIISIHTIHKLGADTNPSMRFRLHS